MDPSFFNLYTPCDDRALLEKIASMASLHRYQRNDLILKMGEAQDRFRLLYSGIACSFVLQKDGTETTDCIMASKGMPVMPNPDLNSPSPDYVQALTACEIVELDSQDIRLMAQKESALSSLINGYLSRAWSDHYKTELALRTLSASDRYDWFLKEYPGVIDNVPHSRIASFLGMSPITLSRVRSAIQTDL